MVLSRDNPAAIERAVAVLSEGGVAVLPCDTIYGLVGRAPDTENRLRAVKGRGDDKPFLMLIADPSWTKAFSDQPLPPALAPFWPGELTLLFRAATGGGKIAFRLPRDPFLLDILVRLNRPLYSTSVNRTGQAHLWRIKEIEREFDTDVDVIVSASDLPDAVPSTILDITATPYAIVRQGKVVIPAGLLQAP
jgi:L-threonylcarbamoyladenylate synthase